MTPEQLKAIRSQYNSAQDRLDEIIADSLLVTYKEIVGKDASTRLSEAIFEALRQEKYR